MFPHVEACRSSKLSQKLFCQQKGIALSTFQYWAKKYRKEFNKDETLESTGFIPIQVQPEPKNEQEQMPGQLHFLFPNGIQVMSPENVDHEVLKTLLNP